MFVRSRRLILIATITAGLAACTAAPGGEGEANLAPDMATENAPAPAGNTGAGVAPPAFPEDTPASTMEVPSGTALTVELTAPVSTETHSAGDEFQAVLTEALIIDGETVIRAGADVVGRVAVSQRAGRVQGVSRIELVLTRLGSSEISTAPFVVQADTERGEDAVRIGTGAGIGAAIGAALGGGDGAAIGAAIGGGAGTAVVLTDRGDDIQIRAEAPIGFVLSAPLIVVE